MYTCGSDRIVPSGNLFNLTLDGREITVSMSTSETGTYRFDFGDGTALDIMPETEVYPMLSAGGTLRFGDSKLILADINHPALRYAAPGETTVEYYTDENGKRVGEMSILMSEAGEYITGYEWFYDNERPAEPEPILLYDGIHLNYNDAWSALYIHPDGSYLLNPEDLFYIHTEYNERTGKQALVGLLMDMAEGRAEPRGIAWAALLYAVVYWIGAATLLWPEQMAFLGSRWRYSSEPELSDEGLIFECLGGAIAMIGSIVLLFMPLFM